MRTTAHTPLSPPQATRRNFLCCGTLLFAGLFGLNNDANAFGFRDGLSNPCATGDAFSPEAQALIAASFADIDPSQYIDMHAHLLGNGDSGSGCHVNDSLYSLWRPIEVLRRKAILGAGCVVEAAGDVDRQYVATLTRLMSEFPQGAKAALFAFDNAYDDHGQIDLPQSTFHVPDTYTRTTSANNAKRFEWVASVHPYREDAVAAITDAQAKGAIALKWLPSAMNINWNEARLKPIYDHLAKTRMPLIAHFGEEKAVPGAQRDEFLNPLHARVPLAYGVRLIVAHCATLGKATDLESTSKNVAPCFDLFARLMADRNYDGLLLADISAVFQDNRSPDVWRRVLSETDWHPRLIQGSDYPLPGVWPLYNLHALVAAGLLNADVVPTLQAIRRRNVLLFDFVLKRQLSSRGAKFSPSVFEARRVLP
jgi:uncharacterized protein